VDVKCKDLIIKGKAKSVYNTDTKGKLIVEFRDDITAFDGGKKDVLTNKGGYNAKVSAFFFAYLEQNGVKTHFFTMLDPHHMVVRKLEMFPLEVIVRNIAAGSIVRNYPFKEGTPLDPPLIVIDYCVKIRYTRRIEKDQNGGTRSEPAPFCVTCSTGNHACGFQDRVWQAGQDDLSWR
jgi:phosphoribosylaminoimidazole-succinocarboxamide synthase